MKSTYPKQANSHTAVFKYWTDSAYN